MQLRTIGSILSLILLGVLLSGAVSAAVLVNEVFPNGVLEPESEWIEIYNNGTSSENLNGWFLRLDDGVAVFALDVLIPANNYRVFVKNFSIFNQSFPNLNVSGQIVAYSEVVTFSLSNTGGKITLRNSSGDDIENFTYNATGENISIGRYPDGSSNIINLSTLSPLGRNDNQAPILVRWLNPQINNSNLSGLVNITVNLTDDTTPINSSFVNFNNTNFTMSKNGNLSYFEWNTSLNANGRYNITVSFNDSYGQKRTDTLLDVVVDNTAPSSFFITPLSGANISGNFTVNVNVSDVLSGVKSVSIRKGTGLSENLNLTSGTFFIGMWNVITNSVAYPGFTGIPSGQITLFLNATDFSGNSDLSQNITITFDNIRPNISIFTPFNTSNISGIVNFKINVTDTTTGVSRVMLRNGTNGNWVQMALTEGNVSAGNWTAAIDTALLSEGSQIFAINATDFASNVNNETYITAVVDNTRPAVSIQSPANNSNLSGTISFIINAIDATSGVQSVQVRNVTGGNWTPLTFFNGTASNGNWTGQLNTLGLSDGQATFTFNVSDFSGNQNAAVFESVTIDNAAPVIALVIPSNLSNVTGIINITVTITDALTGVKNVTLGNGSLGISSNLLGMSLLEGNASRGNWTLQLDTRTLSNGNRVFGINASDFAGSNSGVLNPFFINLTIDNIIPSLVVLSPASLANISGSMNITVTAIDAQTGVKSVSVRNGTGGNVVSLSFLEGTAANGNWSALLDTTALTNGAFNVSFNATDFVGFSNSSEFVSITVDNSNPVISGFSGNVQNGGALRGIVTLNATANDSISNIRSFRFQVNSTLVAAANNTPRQWSASFNTATLPDGIYNITALASDFASNDGLDNVLISEVMFNGLGADSNIRNEWVELYNPTNQTINLTGWDLTTGSSLYTFNAPLLLSPRSSILIVENATFFNETYGVVAVYQNSTFSLTDSGGNLTLRNQNNGAVDFVAWGNDAGWNITADENRTIIRTPVGQDTNLPGDFIANATATPGSVSNPDFITITIDNLAPNVIGFNGFVIAGANIAGARIINVSITDAATAVNTVQFNLTNSSGTVAMLNATNTVGSFWTAALSSGSFGDGLYNLTVFANDTAGNVNSSAMINVTLDNNAPRASQENPANLTFINKVVNINITVTLNDSIAKVNTSSITFNINGFNFAPTTIDSSTNGVLTSFFAVGPYSNGQNFSIRVDARDFAGNLVQDTWSFAIDAITPKIQTILVNDTDRKARSSDVLNVSVNATNGASGVSNVALSNGSFTTQLAFIGSNVWQVVSPLSSLGCAIDGNCTLSVNVTDAAGNSNTTEMLSIVSDSTKPAIFSYTANDSDRKVRSAQSILFNATINDTNFDSGSLVAVRNSTSVSLALQSSVNSTSVWAVATTATALGCNASLGTCRVTLVATDIVGNINGSEVIEFTIDDATPSINRFITNDSNNIVRNDTVLNLTVNVTDANTIVSVSINSTPLVQFNSGSDLWFTTNATSQLCKGTVDAICVLGITATDNVSNINSSEIFQITIDQTSPSFVKVNTSDDNGILASSASVNFTANVTDTFNVSQVTLNGTFLVQQPNSTLWLTTNTTAQLGCPSDGGCSLLFTAVDNAGNRNNQSLNFTVDNTFPALLTFSSSPGIVFNTLNVTLAASFNDTNGISSVLFENNATGTRQNITGTSFSSTNFTAKINTSVLTNGAVIGWKAYGFDAAGKLNDSMVQQAFGVQNRIPTFSAPANITFAKNQNGSINLSSIFSDADSDRLNFSALKPQNITVIISNSTGIAILDPDQDFFGTQNITFTAFDGFGSNSTGNILVNVTFVNTLAPIISTIPNFNISEDSHNASVNLSNFVSDGDNADEEITWRTIGNSSVIVRINQTTKIVNISAVANFNGQETIFFLASDGIFETGSNAVTVTVRAVNDAPTAPTLLSPSNNSNTSSSSIILNWSAATDVDGDSVSYFVFFSNTSSPAPNATTSDRNITVNNLTKGATYYWKVISSDSQLNGTNSSTFQFTAVNNRAPINNASIPNVTWLEETSNSSIVLLNYFQDGDGDSLTFGSTLPSNITVSINQATGVVTLTPRANFSDIVTIVFNATDGTSSVTSNTVTLTVQNVNDAPAVISVSPSANPSIASQSGSQVFNMTFADVDSGDRPTSAWFRNGTSIAPANASNVTIANLATGTYNVSVIVTDNASASARFEWVLTVSGNISGGSSLTSPVLSLSESARQSATNVTINSSSIGSIDFGSNTLNFSGISNLEDAFNISRGQISVNTDQYPGLNRSATLVMQGLTFPKAPLIFMASGFESTTGGTQCPVTICTSIVYNPSTGKLNFNVAHFTTFFTQTNATNAAPNISSDAKVAAQTGVVYTYAVGTTDPDGDALTFSLLASPSGMSVGSSSGVISWLPSQSQIGVQNVSVRVSDGGGLTSVQGFQLIVTNGPKMAIESVDVKVDSKTRNDLENNSFISKKAVPGSKVTFKVKIANLFTNEENLDINDVEVNVDIKDVDDGDDLDDDADSFDLDQGRSKTVSIPFDIPLEVDEDTYDVVITVEGKDENDTVREVQWALFLEVEKEKHELRILNAEALPGIVRCEQSIRLPVEVINTGQEDEDKAIIEVRIPFLDYAAKVEADIDSGSDDNTFQKDFTVSIPKGLAEGIYPIEVATYYDTSKVSETKTISLEKKECIQTQSATQPSAPKAELPKVDVVQQQKSVQKPQQAPLIKKVKKTTWQQFEESDNYALLLISAFAGLSLIVITMAGALIVRMRR